MAAVLVAGPVFDGVVTSLLSAGEVAAWGGCGERGWGICRAVLWAGVGGAADPGARSTPAAKGAAPPTGMPFFSCCHARTLDGMEGIVLTPSVAHQPSRVPAAPEHQRLSQFCALVCRMLKLVGCNNQRPPRADVLITVPQPVMRFLESQRVPLQNPWRQISSPQRGQEQKQV